VMRRLPVSSLFALTVLVSLTSVAACGSGNSGGSAASSPAVTHSATTTGPPSPTPSAPACDQGAWQSAPLSGPARMTVPGIPVLTAVRSAQHQECGYDRLVLDFTGSLPGYSIRFVSQVRADPSDRLIRLPGSHFLLITLRPAQMHTSAGVPTMTDKVRVLGYPMLAGWAPAGDFEGYVTVAVGLAAKTQVRVGELPGRIYIDFKE
jgi:hypothetical protein